MIVQRRLAICVLTAPRAPGFQTIVTEMATADASKMIIDIVQQSKMSFHVAALNVLITPNLSQGASPTRHTTA